MDYEFVPGYIAIKIINYTSIAKCISILRKYSPASMSEIKGMIESQNYVLSCRYTNSSGIRKIRKCYDELSRNGIVVDIYEHDNLTTREFISNLLDTHHEIDLQIQSETDAEADDESDD